LADRIFESQSNSPALTAGIAEWGGKSRVAIRAAPGMSRQEKQ